MDKAADFQYFQHSLFFQHDAGCISHRNRSGKFSSRGCISIEPKFKNGIDITTGRHWALRDWFLV